MAAKLLQALADDNPDLQKHIGCMTGIFQLFDRNNVLASRRSSQRRLPAGNSIFTEGRSERQTFDIYSRQRSADINSSKTLNEKQRISTESSFSSSCSSSISSLDYGRTEASSIDRVIFPDKPLADSVINQPSSASKLGRPSLDLRDVVKDSMYRDSKGVSVKTTSKHETLDQIVRHEDSLRPFPLSMSLDESIAAISKGKQLAPADIKGSVGVREAPWWYGESRERPRSLLYKAEDGNWCNDSKDARRFSYDGREMNRLSFESRDTIKSTPKLKELPRLSLDSWEILSSNCDSRSNYLQRDPQSVVNVNDNFCDSQQSEGTQKRPPSVVAKLMGLEALPDSTSTSSRHSDLTKSCPVQPRESYSRLSKANNLNRPIRIPNSARSSLKGPTSPRWRNSDSFMKPIPKLPIELAPWKQADGNPGSQKQASRPTKVTAKTPSSFPSVYGEIEKRLKDLEFKQSGKDLGALKQILEAMQGKGLLDPKKQDSNFDAQIDYERKCRSPGQKPRLTSQRNQLGDHVNSSIHGGSGCFRTYESPVVIMKPIKQVHASSVIPVGGLPSPHKVPNRMPKDQNPRNNNNNNRRRDLACNSSHKKTSVKNAARLVQSAPKPQQPPKQSSAGSVSPRLQQKKKPSRPPTPPSDPYKPKRESNSSLGGIKSHKLPQSDEQLSQISNDESRTSSLQGDDASSVQSDCTAILNLNPSSRLEDTATVAPEHHPSPVSVLDVSVYRDDSPSPVKQTPSSMLIAGSQNEVVEIGRKKLENVGNLVKKLERLNSRHDEATTDHIASLCETSSNPDHRYISEVLLASGILLLLDLGSSTTTLHLHPSGHPINPELFFVLEQTKKTSSGKIRRKLLFDAVNEILINKLPFSGSHAEPMLMSNKLATTTPTAQNLLKQVCQEIEQLQCSSSSSSLQEEEDGGCVKSILCDDVMIRSESWTDFHNEFSRIGLEVERWIFKELVNEVVIGEATGLGRRRKL